MEKLLLSEECAKKYKEQAKILRIERESSPKFSVIEVYDKVRNRNIELNIFLYPESLGKSKAPALIFLVATYITKIKHAEERKRRIVGKKNASYEITGEVVGIGIDPKISRPAIVVDCGIYILCEIEKEQKFNIGDYVRFECRLDMWEVWFKEWEKKKPVLYEILLELE
jgi:hypothetical protein